MSKLHIDQKTVLDFLKDDAGILIPDYQRQYSWEETQLAQMWDDFVDYALPEDSDPSRFDRDSDYFLGAIVAFNNGGEREIVDGQQRLTSLILLLRAYGSHFASKKEDAARSDGDADGTEKEESGDEPDWDQRIQYTLRSIASCIWRSKEFHEIDQEALKFKNEVASDSDKQSLRGILRDGYAKTDDASNYAIAFRFFLKQLTDLEKSNPDSPHYLLDRILNNVILLPIETNSQETALDLFSTINDRGMPLYDSDIFKTKIFNHYKKIGKFEGVADRWKRMERNCGVFDHGDRTSAVDVLFNTYMHYSLAKNGVMGNHRDKMRTYYSDSSRKTLEKEETFEDLERLSEFWAQAGRFLARDKKDLEREAVFSEQNAGPSNFSESARRSLYVLSYSPFDAWKYILSAAYLRHAQDKDWLSGSGAAELLEWVSAFLVGCCVKGGSSRLAYNRLYDQIVNIVWEKRKYERHRFDADELTAKFRNMQFIGERQLKRKNVAFLLAWWAFRFKGQAIPPDCAVWELDQLEGDPKSATPESGALWSLGNRVLLESEVRRKLSRRFLSFADKKSVFLGGYGRKGGTKNAELIGIAQGGVFGKREIERRNDRILESILDALRRTSQLEE